MSSPLHVLAVGLTDAEATLLSSSLLAGGFVPEIQRANEAAEAAAGLDAAFELVVVGPGAPAAAQEQLVGDVKARRLPAYVVGLAELLSEDPRGAGGFSARLSSVLARRTLDDRNGGHDGVSLMAVLNTGPSEVYVFDAQTLRIKYANDEAVRNSGYPRRRFLGMRAFDLTPQLNEEAYQRLVRPLGTRERDVVSFVTDHRRLDGSTYPITLYLRWTQRGHEAIYVVIGQDLTQVRRLERERDRHRAALDASRDGVLVIGPSGEILEANDAAARLYRRTVPELVAARVEDLVVQHAHGMQAEQVMHAVHRRKDGTRFDAEVLQHVVEASGERVTVLVVRDISSVRRLAVAEQEATDSLRTFMQAAPDPVMMLDSAGRVTAWSHSAERLFGWSAADLVGRAPPIVPPEREQEWQTLLRLTDEGNSLGPLQVTRLRRDGGGVEVRLSMAPLRGRTGRSRGIVAVMTELAEQSRVEVERAHLIAALDAITDEVYLIEPGTLQVRFANEHAARACGATLQSMVALTWLDVEPSQTPELFAALPGASGVEGATSSHDASLKHLGDGDMRSRRVRVSTTEHAGIRVHVVVATEPGAGSDEGNQALRAAGLGQVHVHADGTVLSIEPRATELLGAACLPDSSIAELAGLAGAPELVTMWQALEREREVHTSCSVAGGARRLALHAFRASDLLRTFVLGPAPVGGAADAGADLALRSLSTGEPRPALEAACEAICRDTDALAAWVAVRDDAGGLGALVTSRGMDAVVAAALLERLRARAALAPSDVLALRNDLRGLGLGDVVVLRPLEGAGGRAGLLGVHVRASEVERAPRGLDARCGLIEAALASVADHRAARRPGRPSSTVARSWEPWLGVPGLDELGPEPGAWSAAVGVALERLWEVQAVLGREGLATTMAALVERTRAALPEGARLVRGRGDVLVALVAQESVVELEALALRLAGALAEPIDIDGVHELRVGTTTTVVTGTRDAHALALGIEAGLSAPRSPAGDPPRHVQAPVTDAVLQRQAREQALRHALARDGVVVQWEAQVDLSSGAVLAYVAAPRWVDEAGVSLSDAPLLALAHGADAVGWLEALARAARPLVEIAGCPRVVLPVVGGPGPARRALLRRVLGAAADVVSLELVRATSAELVPPCEGGVPARIAVGDALDVVAWSRAASEGLVVDAQRVASSSAEADARAMLQVCAAAASALGVPLVAAGVERPEQLEALRAAGCLQARGPAVQGRLSTSDVCERLTRARDGHP